MNEMTDEDLYQIDDNNVSFSLHKPSFKNTKDDYKTI